MLIMAILQEQEWQQSESGPTHLLKNTALASSSAWQWQSHLAETFSDVTLVFINTVLYESNITLCLLYFCTVPMQWVHWKFIFSRQSFWVCEVKPVKKCLKLAFFLMAIFFSLIYYLSKQFVMTFWSQLQKTPKKLRWYNTSDVWGFKTVVHQPLGDVTGGLHLGGHRTQPYTGLKYISSSCCSWR